MLKRRIFAILFILMLSFVALSSMADAEASATLRVWLRSLPITDAVMLRFQGDYMLSDGSAAFVSGTELGVTLVGGKIVLHGCGMSVSVGEDVTFIRCAGDAPGSVTLGASNPYEGDLRLFVAEGMIRPVLTIGIEDYLMGVVPYEMGDSFPLEALKAQAIAARTYALRKRGSSGDYDVEDTTNDQAFRGRSASSPLSEQAVAETEGICGVYKDALAQCYYSASNGGQTELAQHVWPVEDPSIYGYMDMRDDPYDYENELSIVKRYTVPKKPGEGGVGPALHAALVDALSERLLSLGVTPENDLIRIDEVLSVEAITPRYDGDSRLMTELRFTLRLSAREATFRAAPSPTPTPLPDPSASPQPTPTEEPAPTATPAYSPFTALAEEFEAVLPIFGEGGAEQAMGLSISTTPNELLTVLDIGSGFMIEARRYGHGVGMSQRGAERMARAYGFTCQQILEFYYPGMQLMRYVYEDAPLPTADAALMATPAPTPEPTPRPTPMPVTAENLPEGAYLAVVENIAEDSTLNLRESASMGADVLMRLPKGQELIVLSSSKDGWSHVKTDVIEGYVRTEYLAPRETR